MPAGAQAQMPTVFISYAHESDALRASVRMLAEWLRGHGCSVLTDHAYVDRPPAEGWLAWMRGCITRANTVLVVCTPKLKARYEKTAAPDSGRGATYEGAIVTRSIYDDAMRNTKFFPILPDGGMEDDIPTELRDWWNGHRFPSGSEGIRRMVFAESGAADPAGSPPDDGSSTWSIGTRQERVAAERLDAGDALPFFRCMQMEMADEFAGMVTPRTAAEMVRWLAECPADRVQDIFVVVRRALLYAPLTGPSARHAAEEAAAALYWLAACRLVDRAAHSGQRVMHALSDERLISAIIATALFGGELRIKPAEEPGLPAPEYVYVVQVPAGGDQFFADFDRAAYVTLFANDREAPRHRPRFRPARRRKACAARGALSYHPEGAQG